MYDIVALGELLIDFTPAEKPEKGNPLFEMNPGGAPANVLAAAVKLGKRCAFIGKVGNDAFGRFSNRVLMDIGVDTRGLLFSEGINTTLAFVHLDDKGDRSFSFYRNPGADMMLAREEIDFTIIDNCSIFHFGSVSLTSEPCRSATLSAVKHARKKGLTISYDPNLRPALWESLALAKEMIIQGLEYADILKISEEELLFITSMDDLEEGSKYLSDKYDICLIMVTLGAKGCFYRFGCNTGILPTYDVKTIDTTGAGDAFLGGILYKILDSAKGLKDLSVSEIEHCIDFANAVGSLATTQKGAIPAMPALEDVEACMCNVNKLVKKQIISPFSEE